MFLFTYPVSVTCLRGVTAKCNKYSGIPGVFYKFCRAPKHSLTITDEPCSISNLPRIFWRFAQQGISVYTLPTRGSSVDNSAFQWPSRRSSVETELQCYSSHGKMYRHPQQEGHTVQLITNNDMMNSMPPPPVAHPRI